MFQSSQNDSKINSPRFRGRHIDESNQSEDGESGAHPVYSIRKSPFYQKKIYHGKKYDKLVKNVSFVESERIQLSY